jgi:hypothetical protein
VAPLWAICHNKTHPKEVQLTDKAERQLWKCEIVVLVFWLSYFFGFLAFQDSFYSKDVFCSHSMQ